MTEAEDRPGAPRRALVADDVADMRMSLSLALGDAGYEVTAVSTGRAALETLRDGRFDLAVLDLWMPDGDGLSVLKAVRASQPGLRVFVVTGGGPRLPLEAAALIASVWGAERVIIKPFDERELIAAARAGPGDAAGRLSLSTIGAGPEL